MIPINYGMMILLYFGIYGLVHIQPVITVTMRDGGNRQPIVFRGEIGINREVWYLKYESDDTFKFWYKWLSWEMMVIGNLLSWWIKVV